MRYYAYALGVPPEIAIGWRPPRSTYDGSEIVFRSPVIAYYEVDDEGWIQRSIEIFGDGRQGVSRASDTLEVGGTYVPERPVPLPLDSPDWTEISASTFLDYWDLSIVRLGIA